LATNGDYSAFGIKFSDNFLTFAPRLQLTGITIFLKTKNREMSNYELMVIFTPVLSEEEFKTAQKKYEALVKDNGGEVTHTNPWGLKSLAYPVAKKTTGLYWVMEYSAPTSFNEKLKIQYLTAIKADKRPKKYCRFKKMGIRYIDYKDGDFLKKFLNEQGKLLPRRITGNSLKFQRKVSEAVKKARQMAILPYVTDLMK
jgi:small subunit ribosomal protein S18